MADPNPIHHISPFHTVKPLTSVLVKPAGADCNLACEYCFYLKKSALYPETPRHRMSEAVLEELVRQVMQDGAEALSFGWQGGEPTLLGLDFFRQAVEFQKRYGRSGQSVGNGLQTNGLLLDESWAGLFTEHNFLIGLSLDGPPEIHDTYRRSRGGEPTGEKVVQTARMLLRNQVEVNALCVVNDLSVRHPDEIYDFFKSLGLRYMQFIPCVETDSQNPASPTPYSVPAGAYGEMLCRLFDRWLKDFKNGVPTTSIRWFDSLFYTYVGMIAPECTLMPECGCYVVVEHNGDVYACDFFVEPEWKLGNLMEGSLLEMLNSPREREFGAMKGRLPEGCPECPWLRHCWGGCTKDRLHNPLAQGVNPLCEAFKIFFDHANPRLEQLAAQWIRKEREHQVQEQRRAVMQRTQSTGMQRPGSSNRPASSRNAACPCGSGRKFKHCCGK